MESKSIIISILIFLGVAYIFFLTYIIAKFIKDRQIRDAELIKTIISLTTKNQLDKLTLSDNSKLQKLAIDNNVDSGSTCENKINTNYQTDFFMKSVNHAEDVLKTKMILDKYKYGNFMDLTKVDNQTKQAIVIAIKYMSIEPVKAKAIEQQYRSVSETEKVPLWFVILHEAIKKVMSSNEEQVSEFVNLTEIKSAEVSSSSYEPKIIPIGKVA